ncbi:hypothetical protein FRC19_003755 [Serendipita sp. 401]|nr:hypothetical protein FRC19_003755 [Serendipita sp. 401]
MTRYRVLSGGASIRLVSYQLLASVLMHVLTLFLSLLSYLLIASAYHTTSYNASSPSLLYTPSNLWHADEIPSGDNCSHWLIYHWADDFASITLSFEGVAFDLYVYSWTVGGNYTLQIDDEEPTQVSGRTLDGACVPPYSKGNLTYTTHNVTLNLYGSLVGYTVTVPDPGDEPSTPSASAQSDKAKRRLVIIAAACGAGGGFLIALFFSLPPTASTQWSSLRSSMLSQTESPQQQQPPPQYRPGLLGSLLSQTESNVKVQTKGKGPATEKARTEPEAESELERGTKKLSWMDRYPIGSPVSMLSVPPPAANPVRNAIPNIRHSNPTAPITRAPDWENSGEALD